jgi:hypothetical protein
MSVLRQRTCALARISSFGTYALKPRTYASHCKNQLGVHLHPIENRKT